MKINLISAVGDPNSPKTWSGTTLNLMNALESAGRMGKAYIAGNNNFVVKLMRSLLARYYTTKFRNGKDQMMMSFRYTRLRWLYSWSSNLYIKESNDKHALHFGSTSLPYLRRKPGEYHYCYIDATWNIWLANSTNIDLIGSQDQSVIEMLEAKSFKNVDHIFSISDYVKQNLMNHYKIESSKITVVGTGTGIIQPYFGPKDYNNVKVLFVAKGRFEDKGGHLVLKAFELLLEKHPGLQLSIVGQKDYSSFPNHPNIKTYGFIPINELQALFDSHSLFLMPAINEPWGLVYIEAMLCKMPIVGININSFPELSRHGKYGVGIDKADPEVLSEALNALISKPEIMERMGLEAQRYALDNYTWEKVASKMLGVIDDRFVPEFVP